MPTEQKTVLVTGGAGFIGFNLIKKLVKCGYETICLDDLSCGLKEHALELESLGNCKFIFHDVVNPIDLQVDIILNLACPASPPAYQRDPIKTTLTSVLGIRNLLELARAKGARLVQASTSEVYGDPLEHPQRESYFGNVNTMGPRACYDEGKRCAETLIYDYSRIHGVDARIARIFNTYGPGMRVDDGRVVSNFIVQALRGEDVTIYGDGRHTRSMCFVDDLVDGLIRLMEFEDVGVAPINLGNPREISVAEFAELVVAMTGSPSRIVYLPEVVDDPHLRRPDITRARDILHWQPRVPLENGIRETISFFRAQLAETVETLAADLQP
jgi:UDP-glucuronate decarboxylase